MRLIKPLGRFWMQTRKAAGLPDTRIHDLRHTHASILISSGVAIEKIGQLLGHTQIATTQRYAHLANTALRDATNVFATVVTVPAKPAIETTAMPLLAADEQTAPEPVDDTASSEDEDVALV